MQEEGLLDLWRQSLATGKWDHGSSRSGNYDGRYTKRKENFFGRNVGSTIFILELQAFLASGRKIVRQKSRQKVQKEAASKKTVTVGCDRKGAK